MAHRIYIYNVNLKTKETYPFYLAEWNYEIPILMRPLFSANIRSKGSQLFANKEDGIARLRYFYALLADRYQLHYKKKYYEPVNRMFEFLGGLPFDTFQIDGRDVFSMNAEKDTLQAKAWAEEISMQALLYEQAVDEQSLDPLGSLLETSGYASFLDALQTDWIDYGLGLWSEELLRDKGAEVFEAEGKQGLRNAKGDLLIPAIYDEIFEFNEQGIAVVEANGRFGYIHASGAELVSCQYSDAFDARSIHGNNYAEVEVAGKRGVLHIDSKQLSIPALYDELDWIAYGFLNARQGESNILLSVEGRLIISDPVPESFMYDYNKLFYSRQKGTIKKKYYLMDGQYLGTFLEGSLEPLANRYFWIKPNKLQPKISVIQPNGNMLDEGIDRIIVLEGYRSIAYLKNKKWQLYSLEHGIFRLMDNLIENVAVDSIQQYRKDIFVLSCSKTQGIYDAHRGKWLLEPADVYQKIEHCFLDFMRIHCPQGMRYFDTKLKFCSEPYDYICSPFHYPAPDAVSGELLLLFKGERMFYLDLNRNVIEIPETAFGYLYTERYHLQGRDQNYFVQFYQAWTKRKGDGYEQYFDNDTLMEKGKRLDAEGKFSEAIRLLTIGAGRGSADCQYLLGNIYTDADYEGMDIEKGKSFYEQAMAQDHAQAWNNWAFLYATAHGVELDISKALKGYRQAVALGEAQAMSNLGNWYYEGVYVEQDHSVALDYFKQAEKAGIFNDAQMAEIYYQRHDYTNLLRYLKRDKANQFAAIYYGILYEEGLGVKQSLPKAIRYYEQANQGSVYVYAVNRLLQLYAAHGVAANAEKYEFWLHFAKENAVEIE
ncbi:MULTISPECIES: SEL1-like repeat protein [unclassified Sphingobacterium]|uniref:SEL1-like repeat protein n=1 Tax=unclassified Sphingobacterium TaxID=2609468 RepID=UPI0025F78A1C|nr:MULTISPECIES: tetratricopeptide repeat protein [unclassified Sphingobacterium]